MSDRSWNTVLNRGEGEHLNDTATTTAQSYTFQSETSWLKVFNKSNNTELKISFDGGSTYFTIPVYHFEPFDKLFVTTIYYKTDSGTAEFEIVAGTNSSE